MKLYINRSPKGHVIYLYSNNTRVKYFFKDEQHVFNKAYIERMIKQDMFTVKNVPFGDGIYPIHLNLRKKLEIAKETVNTIKVNCLITSYKMNKIWMYYRGLVSQNDKPRFIKKYAEEMKTKLSLLGVDGLYSLIQQD